MDRFIRKYKDVNYKVQSSRKGIKTITIIFLLFIIILCAVFLSLGAEYKAIGGYCIIFTVLFCFFLYFFGWSIETKDNVVIVKKGIFVRARIPFKDLIAMEGYKETVHSSRQFSTEKIYKILIKYKKGKHIKHISVIYLKESVYSKIEFAKINEIRELINIFSRQGEIKEVGNIFNIQWELMENRKENPEYKNIRTEQEEKEIEDLLKLQGKREEKIIWIVLFAVIIIPIVTIVAFTIGF